MAKESEREAKAAERKAEESEKDRVETAREADEKAEEAREKMLGELVSIELLEDDVVLPNGEKAGKGDIVELPHEQARLIVQMGRAKFNETDRLTGEKKATTKGRRKTKRGE